MRKTICIGLLLLLILNGVMIMPAFGQDGHPLLVSINSQLEQQGVNYRIEMAQYITTTEGPEFGRTVYATDRGNKQLGHHFVPYDSRRPWSGPDSAITWINDLVDGATVSGLTPTQTAMAIRSAMTTWDSVKCSTIPLRDLGDFNFDFGVVQYQTGYGGVNGVAADYTHAGFLPGSFFDLLAPSGSTYILGVTFTAIFIDGSGNPTDIDANKKTDTAFRETYYNDKFSWAIDTNYDVETVALHEAGHGLSQGHFGAVFRDGGKSKLHVATRAVMNSVYLGVQQELMGTDNAGHCSIWAKWPNK